MAIEELVGSGSAPPRAPQQPDAASCIAIPASAACTACVVIPARDEADSIERTLEALADQRTQDGRRLVPDSYEVILLANNCRDETAAVARRLADRLPELTLHIVEIELAPSEAHVGTARRVGMDEGCRRLLSLGRPRGVIATTDADTWVAPTWLAATLREVDRGAEAVGGRILVAPEERRSMPRPVRSRFLRNVGYWALVDEVTARVDPRPGDPWPRHEQFFGASLAITAGAYLALGGLPRLPSGEDVALARALRRADIEVRHSIDVRVHTSGRLDGRTPAGLAALLAGWSSLSSDAGYQRVPSAATVVARATCCRALRDIWTRARATRDLCNGDVVHLAERAGVPGPWLRQVILDAERFGILRETVEARATWARQPELVDVRVAIDDLRAWLEPYRRDQGGTPQFARHIPGGPLLPPSPAPGAPMVVLDSSSLPPLEQIESVRLLSPPPQVA